MHWAVLVKGVPPVEQLRFDPTRRTMIREGTELVLNPFDRRAVQLGVNLRRPGEALTVISMGPSSVEGPLREALAVGADRVVLVSDPVLAGSDTLVTARVLARALEHVGHEVVLTGRWAVDSETGQVGPEVAGLLGIPVVSGAREVTRDTDESLVVTSSTGEGWRRARWPVPVLISVGEDAVKVRRPLPAELEAVRARPLDVWNTEFLDLAPSDVGLEGSPTVVTSLRDDQPVRSPVVVAEGTMPDRARRAAELVSEHLVSRPRPAADTSVSVPGPLADDREVFVLATNQSGAISDDALPLVAEVRRNLAWLWPSVVCVGPEFDDTAVRRVSSTGAFRAYTAQLPSAQISSYSVSFVLHRLLDRRPHLCAGLVLADDFGREVAGQFAARAGLGLVGDAVSIRGQPGSRIAWEKPSFGGGILATIETRSRPALATVRPGSFGPGPPSLGPPSIDVEPIPGPFPLAPVESLDSGREVDGRYGDLDHARVVVTVGTGVGGPEGIAELLPWVRAIGGAIGATRRVADARWLPRQLQVGLTGRSVAPALAILVGVSGATNHLVGLRRARTILALNSDPQAPVFRWVDVGVVGPWRETLPPLLDAFAKTRAYAQPAP